MNKYINLAEKLEKREKVIGTTMTVQTSTIILEAMNRDDLDFVLFDCEHGIFDTQNVVSQLQICRLIGLPVFLRAQDAEYHLIAKAIDMGADGVMVPRTESLEQLRTAVDALLFYPDGRKGAVFQNGDAVAVHERFFQKRVFCFRKLNRQKVSKCCLACWRNTVST